MKKLLLAYALCVFFFAYLHNASAQLTTASVTVTNTPTNGYTITLNGTALTWTNNANTSLLIANTNTIGAAATNLFNAIVGSGISGITYVSRISTNGVTIVGNNLLIAISTNWATLSTNNASTTNTMFVVVPGTAIQTPSAATNMFSLLISSIDRFATNVLSAGATAMSNFVNLSASQTITGQKTFTAANVLSNANQFITGGGLSNVALTNITFIMGTNGVLWSLGLVNPNLTNGQNFGAPFRSPSGLASEQFGTSSSASGINSVAFGNTATTTNDQSIVIGFQASVTGDSSICIGENAGASGASTVVFGSGSAAFGSHSSAFGSATEADGNTSTAIGYGAVATLAHQFRIGTSAEYVSIPGNLQVEGSSTNLHVVGTNTWDGDVSFNRKNMTSLANGANSISASTNLYLKVSGPSGAFTINGISGGRDGRLLIIQNSTGFTLTVANESGTEPTAANRIQTGTGADVSQANNPGCVTLIYDSATSRWVLVSKN